ncbi:ribonuclease P [Gloeomargarita lithophora Alchichica-D10]|uniref:Ribonuclease P n=1 Tax=Gloeomargarita lithophora Alchichica-D10 TaxID=1188229 RepID=A0A1J0ABV6_9CYAN|nr:PH domain-containing protein [Gloeomargarita lithophora]APB33411.1 ribonuclease P [Gloeomargarita lithophora Alchichica-D10]
MGIREDVIFEGGPHRGDLILNLVLGFTLIWLPLTIGAVTRALWLRYRITSRRVTVNGGWLGQNRSDVIYSEITKVVTISRGFGFWGDMVITLKDGKRLELRSLPRFRELASYITERIDPQARQASTPLGQAT